MADIFGDFEDPTADFLAREQEILGEDAALFGNDTGAIPAVPTHLEEPVATVYSSPTQPPSQVTTLSIFL